MIKKYLDTSWDFRNVNTKSTTHCFHSYPAMMIPQVARKLIEKYGNNSGLLFDPYCGTGTSLVEANLLNINAIGTDLNPLARIIAKAKTTPIRIQTLDLYLKDFNDLTFLYKFGIDKSSSIVVPNFKNIDYWFSHDVKSNLAIIKNYIENISELKIKNFFKVAFSETIRDCSWTSNSEFKLVRMKESKMNSFNPDVFGLMEFKLSRNRNGIFDFMNNKINDSISKVYDFNTVNKIPKNILFDNSVDLVVTSPPYGDSRTTVAYGQFSRLANQWLDVEDASSVDNNLMGGKKYKEDYLFEVKQLDNLLNEIREINYQRSLDVKSFFMDYQRSINNIAKVVKKNGFVCYILGNRNVSGFTIPLDEITRSFFEMNGFKYIETIIRNIPSKRMPFENSPSNIKGSKSPTMKNEFIVISQKIN